MMVGDNSFNGSLALDWLTNSGIQDASGGFYAWYRADNTEYAFLYPEVTGYAIQLLCKFHNHQSRGLCEAVEAGDWLVANQNRDGAFFSKQFTDSKQQEDTFYTFDGGVITSALIDLFELTSDDRYLIAAVKTANLILTLQNPDGSFKAKRSLYGAPVDNQHWSQTSACHHLKLMIPLLKINQLTSEKKFLVASKNLLKWGLRLQRADGRFVNFWGTENTYVHAHCYATEGLLGASVWLEKAGHPIGELYERINKSIEWLLDVQNSDGSFYNWSQPHRERVKVSDSLSQAMRLFLLLDAKQRVSKKEAVQNLEMHIEAGFSFLANMQMHEKDKRIEGGVSYGKIEETRLRDVNTCATVFAVHAEFLRYNHRGLSFVDQII